MKKISRVQEKPYAKKGCPRRLTSVMFLFLLVFTASMFVLQACKSKSKALGKGTSVIISNEGWLDENTYQMVVYGQWDRNVYYEEDKKGSSSDDDVIGKKPKPTFGLREDAKTAAKVKAMRNFKEKMVAYVESESKVDKSELLSDVVTSRLRGLIIAPQSVREEYSKSHDASITFVFSAEGLRGIVDGAVAETLRRFKEEGDNLNQEEEETY